MKLSALFSILLLPLLLFGQGNSEYDESFDPTSLNDWGTTKARIEKIRSLSDHYATLGDQLDTVEVIEYSSHVFRVQLWSTVDREEAMALQTSATAIFEEEVVMQFDSPYYKVRVGKMNNREDAQELQTFAIQNGFRRAWVIRTENDKQQ